MKVLIYHVIVQPFTATLMQRITITPIKMNLFSEVETCNSFTVNARQISLSTYKSIIAFQSLEQTKSKDNAIVNVVVLKFSINI